MSNLEKNINLDAEKDNENTTQSLSDERRVKVMSPSMLVFKRFIRNRLAVIGFVILAVMFIFSYVGAIFSPYSETQTFQIDGHMIKDYAEYKLNEEWIVTLAEDAELPKKASNRIAAAIAGGKDTCTVSGLTYHIDNVGDYMRMISGYTPLGEITITLPLDSNATIDSEYIAEAIKYDSSIKKKASKYEEDIIEAILEWEEDTEIESIEIGEDFLLVNRNKTRKELTFSFCETGVIGMASNQIFHRAVPMKREMIATFQYVYQVLSAHFNDAIEEFTYNNAIYTIDRTEEGKIRVLLADTEYVALNVDSVPKSIATITLNAAATENTVVISDSFKAAYGESADAFVEVFTSAAGEAAVLNNSSFEVIYDRDGVQAKEQFALFVDNVLEDGSKEFVVLPYSDAAAGSKMFTYEETNADEIVESYEFKHSVLAAIADSDDTFKARGLDGKPETYTLVKGESVSGVYYDIFTSSEVLFARVTNYKVVALLGEFISLDAMDALSNAACTDDKAFAVIYLAASDTVSKKINSYRVEDLLAAAPEMFTSEENEQLAEMLTNEAFVVGAVRAYLEGTATTFIVDDVTYTLNENQIMKDGQQFAVFSPDKVPEYFLQYVLDLLSEDGTYTVRDYAGEDLNMARKKSRDSFVNALIAGELSYVAKDDAIVVANHDGTSEMYYIEQKQGVGMQHTYTIRSAQRVRLYDKYAAPSLDHILGTDFHGMDVATRLMYGGRVSLMVGFIVVIIELVIGIVLGGLAGYFSGWVDVAIMRLIELFNCIPFYPMLMIIGALLDANDVSSQARIYFLMVVLGVLSWPGIARIVRGQILSLREQDFIVATEACGIPVNRRIFRHLIPNVVPLLIVNATMALGGIIITEATLSFLGLGVKYPLASWGSIINQASTAHVMTNYWWIWIPAGVLILLTVLGFNFVGDGLRDAFDPKMKR